MDQFSKREYEMEPWPSPAEISDAIVAELREMDNRYYTVPSEGTREIKRRLGELGHRFDFLVSCNRRHFPAAQDREWLYDMNWWRLCRPQHVGAGKEPYMRRIGMVLESELCVSSIDLNEDFEKIVQARADVRVWIATSPNNAKQHVENCKQQIGLFDRSQAGDHYVFAVYDWTERAPVIEQYIASD
jgi:hypothetical protein